MLATLVAALLVSATPAYAQVQADITDGTRYPVMSIDMRYATPNTPLPALDNFAATNITLGETDGGYVRWREGVKQVRFAIKDYGKLDDFILYSSAIQAITESVANEYSKRGFIGVQVYPDRSQIDASGNDLRQKGNRKLTLVIDAGNLPVSGPVPSIDGSAPAEAPDASDMRYPVMRVELEYAEYHGSLPSIASIMRGAKVRLSETDGGYAAWRRGAESDVEVALSEIDKLPDFVFYGDALQAMSRAVVQEFNRRGIVGLVVTIAPGQIDPATGKDIRQRGDRSLTLLVRPGLIDEVRTVTVDDEGNPTQSKYSNIAEGSPVQPVDAAADPYGSGLPPGVLQKQALDDYIFRLNRYSGRRVDVAVSAGEVPGSFALDYLVNEVKPWTIYGQVSNTGTSQTSEWRERIGFAHHQLTGNNDILRLDYATAGFDESHALLASYEAPFFGSERLRWQLRGGYSEYTASDVGLFALTFSGETISAGGELAYNVYQHRDFFLDAVLGANFQYITVNNGFFEAEEAFFRPEIGLRMIRSRPTDTLSGSVFVEANVPDIADTTDRAASRLGRAGVNSDWVMLKWDMEASAYLAPLFAGVDSSQVEVSNLVHEVSAGLRGQYVMTEDRLPPQMQYTIGGLYSVRGYRESSAVGDNAIVVSGEYRLHVPRMFAMDPGQGDFAWAPRNAYSRPDWDLILRGFIDYGYTSSFANKIATVAEPDYGLLGAGFGAELQLKRNLIVRADWGWAIYDGPQTTSGSSQIHIVGTILY